MDITPYTQSDISVYSQSVEGNSLSSTARPEGAELSEAGRRLWEKTTRGQGTPPPPNLVLPLTSLSSGSKERFGSIILQAYCCFVTLKAQVDVMMKMLTSSVEGHKSWTYAYRFVDSQAGEDRVTGCHDGALSGSGDKALSLLSHTLSLDNILVAVVRLDRSRYAGAKMFRYQDFVLRALLKDLQTNLLNSGFQHSSEEGMSGEDGYSEEEQEEMLALPWTTSDSPTDFTPEYPVRAPTAISDTQEICVPGPSGEAEAQIPAVVGSKIRQRPTRKYRGARVVVPPPNEGLSIGPTHFARQPRQSPISEKSSEEELEEVEENTLKECESERLLKLCAEFRAAREAAEERVVSCIRNASLKVP